MVTRSKLRFSMWAAALSTLLAPSVASAQPVAYLQPMREPGQGSGLVKPSICEPPATCVPQKDMQIFVKILHDKRCQLTTTPQFELDPIQIIIDKGGRIFFSGAAPRPYTLRMNWCNYEVEAKGKVDVVAAMKMPPLWGFRLRPKAYMGILPSEVFYSSDDPRDIGDFMDAGAMVDFLYYDWANLNGAVGYRSFGAGGGVDITENFGAYAGYSMTWGSWRHNLNLSLWFSFWNP